MNRKLYSRTAAALIILAIGLGMPGHNLVASRGGEEAIVIAIVGMLVLFFLAFFVTVYVYFALAFSTIARKTQTPNTWYAWVPILNMVLLLNVAKKPVWWILLFFVPFANIVILVLTWMGVAQARGIVIQRARPSILVVALYVGLVLCQNLA